MKSPKRKLGKKRSLQTDPVRKKTLPVPSDNQDIPSLQNFELPETPKVIFFLI